MSADTVKFNPGERLAWKCQKCAEVVINATAQSLRVAGWRLWVGESAAGSPLQVCVCPSCAVGANVNDEGDKEGFDAACSTCGLHATDEEWDELLTEKDALDWKRDHECEPDVEIIRPRAKVDLTVTNAVRRPIVDVPIAAAVV